jgi:hypothetical protein
MAKRYNDGSYEGLAGRRAQEARDAGMISEDHNAMANLPQNVIMKQYPQDRDYTPEGLDDTISGIDRQKGMDHSGMMKHLKPKKV